MSRDDADDVRRPDLPPLRLAFRSSFIHSFAWTCTFCSVPSAALYLVTWWMGNPVDLPPTILTAGSLAAFLAIMIVIYPVYVLPTGLTTYDAFGNYEYVGWAAIEKTDPVNILGLRYLTFPGTSGRRLYIPFWLSNMEGFIAAVRERAGADHPLVSSLEAVLPGAQLSSRMTMADGDDSAPHTS